ncbi:MAG: molecular chaperone DnaK [Planctomycetaceae bacterium]|nr:molecular chaperone DnaK [Planctomycetaceae bacterium]
MAIQEKIIGIDLGTTNSVVSIMEGGEVKVIANQDGNRLTPSVVAFTEKGDRLVGDPAKRQAVTNPKNTIYSIKRFMGRRHSEVESEEKIVPYKVVGGPSEYVKVEVHGKTYTPPEISAMVLRKLKEAAEAYLGHTVTRAVVTVPAYFNDAQRQATKDAGDIAGLKVDRIINEPTAAALAYGLQTKKNEKIAVFDLGGGTFDISVLEVEDDVIEVLSTNGDTHLGGDDFDNRLVQFVSDKFQQENGIDLRKDAMALQRLREAAEKAKKELSTQQSTDINLPFITADSSGAKHLQLTISRAEFEKLIDDLVERCRNPVESALRDAKLKPEQIDEVVLVGGSTRVPKIQEFVKKLFKGKEPHRGVNPDEVVSIGAAIQGAIITGDVKDMVLFDVTPLSLGIETEGGIMTVLVERNTTIPVTKKETFSTAADGQTAVTVSVYQGERPMARDNRQLSQFNLDGIPPAPRGVPKVEVSFDIDVNGILSVKAKDTGSGKEQTVKVQNASGIDTAEVERMKRDAESHAAEDKRRREVAEAKNKASTSVYEVEKMLKEHGEKLDAGSKSAIEAAIAKVKEAEKGDDLGAITSAVEGLQQASYAMAQHMQNASGAAPGTDGQPEAAGSKDDGVIDAEFEKKS